MNSPPPAHIRLCSTLRSGLEDTVASLIKPSDRVVLLDVPEHSNVGDYAILLGEDQLITGAGGAATYMSSIRTISWSAIRRRSPTKVLLQGGGNFGDLWPDHQTFRETALMRCSDRDVIVFPQSVNFRSKENLHRAQRSVGKHGSVTLMARDQASFELLERHFDARVVLCPDAALTLSIHRSEAPRREAVALLRADKEQKESAEGKLQGIPSRDWVNSSPPRAITWPGLVQRLRARLRPYRGCRVADALLSGSFLPMARYHLHRGIDMLSEGEVVITDRLHGHILCFVMGIPHVVLDNSYGKVFSFVETWTKGSPIVRMADSPSAAYNLAMELYDGMSERRIDNGEQL